jgi:membrane associated rhomboid family serine protease
MNFLDDLKLQYRTGGVAQRLIFWNVGIFLFSLLFFYRFANGFFVLPNWLALNSSWNIFSTTPWTLFTYMFLHGGFLHLLFNMMVLNFAGRLFTTYFTERQLLGLYFLGGIFSGIVFLVSFLLLGSVSQLVGASGAIMALLVATATYAPYMLLRMPLIGTVKLWQVAAVIVLIDLVQVPMNNTGGHIAHLGGALFGFFFVKLLQQGTDLTKVVSNIQDVFERKTKSASKPKTPFKKVHKNPKTTTFSTSSTHYDKELNQKKIDAILDKISQSGYDSLSKEEKEFLFKVGK